MGCPEAIDPLRSPFVTLKPSQAALDRAADPSRRPGCATWCIESRRSMAVRWIQPNASGSVSPSASWSVDLARSTALRASSRSVRSSTSLSSSVISAKRLTRHLDRRHEVGDRERLDEIGHGAGVTSPLDQLALAERREHHDGSDAVARDLVRGGDSVESRHLDVHDDKVRPVLHREGHGLLTVPGLGDDVVTRFGQHLGQIEPDQRLVLGDHDAWPGGRGWLDRRRIHVRRLSGGSTGRGGGMVDATVSKTVV